MAKQLYVGHFADPKQVCEYVNANSIAQTDIQLGLTRYVPASSTVYMYFWWDPAGGAPPACPGIKDDRKP